MKFNADGYLEPGVHDHTVEEIEEHLVLGFPVSSTRSRIMDGYKKHRSALIAINICCEQILDGSFVSTKNDPRDVDFVGFMNVDAVDALSEVEKCLLKKLFSGPATKEEYHCDAYFCPTVPDHDPRYNELRPQRKYWLGEFGFDRHERAKGVVRTLVALAPTEGERND